MRTIQEIFNAAIDCDDYYSRRKLMCWTLRHAEDLGAITIQEARFAAEQIKEYLRDWVLLSHALDCSQTEITPLEVYRDWANRPSLQSKEQAND